MVNNSIFNLQAHYSPSGDQPKAIESLVKGFHEGKNLQTLLGVTGSGKTYTVANVIQQLNLPTLVISHNKTLAAQLYNEFMEYFPDHAVEYFISYYDYYQPEAYIPRTDTYIEKTASVNDEIDRLRHSATRSLYERKDVIVIASVSCIYGLGAPAEYFNMAIKIDIGDHIERNTLLLALVDVHYLRNDIDPQRGMFRVRGDVVDIHPPYENIIIRIEFWGDEVESLKKVDLRTGIPHESLQTVIIYPAVHYLTNHEEVEAACHRIEFELNQRVVELKNQDKILEAQRLLQRTRYDLEMIKEVGYCTGIENYSRIFENRPPGSPPATLMNYFPEDFLLVIDESHITIPQVKGMYNGDAARKSVLVDYGFRLPCAKDNRPLKFDEFWKFISKAIFVSATPSPYEIEKSANVVEQIIRPTGLIDPEIFVKPTKHQIDTLLEEIRIVVEKGERVIVTTLTKRMAEDLTDYMSQLSVRVRYLHSEIKSLERVEIIRDLRLGEFDVLIGVNLLREGLDLPEVSLVVIMDADKEGFLRSETSLIQTIGRAARNNAGKVIMFADTITGSMQKAIDETERRRQLQIAYNIQHNITPTTIQKSLGNNLLSRISSSLQVEDILGEELADRNMGIQDLPKVIEKIEKEMLDAAKILEFERAAELRDQLKKLRELYHQQAKPKSS